MIKAPRPIERKFTVRHQDVPAIVRAAFKCLYTLNAKRYKRQPARTILLTAVKIDPSDHLGAFEVLIELNPPPNGIKISRLGGGEVATKAVSSCHLYKSSDHRKLLRRCADSQRKLRGSDAARSLALSRY